MGKFVLIREKYEIAPKILEVVDNFPNHELVLLVLMVQLRIPGENEGAKLAGALVAVVAKIQLASGKTRHIFRRRRRRRVGVTWSSKCTAPMNFQFGASFLLLISDSKVS